MGLHKHFTVFMALERRRTMILAYGAFDEYKSFAAMH